MKYLTFLTILFSCTLVYGKTAKVTTTYYVGEAITSKGDVVTSHPYISARTVDQTLGEIAEVVISYHENGFAENSSVMTIKGKSFSMKESSGKVNGSGNLIGPKWNWISLIGEFNTHGTGYNMRIIDYNLFAGESTIMGHKDFYLTIEASPEKLYMREDVVLHQVDKQTFEQKRNELLNLKP